MHSRVTLLEIDTMRIAVDEATDLFKTSVLPRLREVPGFDGVLVLATDEGKGMILTFWESDEAASAAAGFATGELERHVALFRSPPGRETYRVALFEAPQVAVG